MKKCEKVRKIVKNYEKVLPFSCDSVGLVQGTKTPQGRKYEKITKKIQNPPPRVGSRKYEKITEKIQKCPGNDHFCIFSVIFSYFRGPTRGGGFWIFFVIFSYFRPWGVFVPCTSPTESQPFSCCPVVFP